MQRFCAALRSRGFSPVAGTVVAGVHCADASEPSVFLGQCLAAWEVGANLALCAADWTEAMLVSAREVLQSFAESSESAAWNRTFGPLVLIPTGGSSGRLRFAVHSVAGLRIAADGFVERFGAPAAAALNVLPLYHVGGFMTVLRAFAASVPWQASTYRSLFEKPPPLDCRGSISVVPTQLHRLLQHPLAVDQLRSFGHVFVGGASLSPADACAARQYRLRLSPCYGMTESAAMVVAMDSTDFLAGNTGCGSPLPHATVAFSDGEGTADRPGRIFLGGAAMAVGLWPGGAFDRLPFPTSDEGFFDSGGSLHITRRLDRMITSGGEKIDPERVEAVMRPFLAPAQIHVEGMVDADWGERVVAFVEGAVPTGSIGDAAWTRELRAFECPKEIVPLEALPRNAMGKIDRAALQRIWLQSHLPPASFPS